MGIFKGESNNFETSRAAKSHTPVKQEAEGVNMPETCGEEVDAVADEDEDCDEDAEPRLRLSAK
jgi:hypothetical protein